MAELQHPHFTQDTADQHMTDRVRAEIPFKRPIAPREVDEFFGYLAQGLNARIHYKVEEVKETLLPTIPSQDMRTFRRSTETP
ncbi:hypothetical protein GF342_05280 [Candidatus Woesearchaeota archaeon]|nr:hypothetical protein [Candidatus Woesearchaeota archaeon]